MNCYPDHLDTLLQKTSIKDRYEAGAAMCRRMALGAHNLPTIKEPASPLEQLKTT